MGVTTAGAAAVTAELLVALWAEVYGVRQSVQCARKLCSRAQSPRSCGPGNRQPSSRLDLERSCAVPEVIHDSGSFGISDA